jgi:hypothetical protein
MANSENDKLREGELYTLKVVNRIQDEEEKLGDLTDWTDTSTMDLLESLQQRVREEGYGKGDKLTNI